MRRSYLLVYNEEFGSREAVKNIVDAEPEILNWRFELPSTFYLVSELSANDLAKWLQEKTGRRGRFIVVEATPNKQGLLDPKSWRLMNEKHDPE